LARGQHYLQYTSFYAHDSKLIFYYNSRLLNLLSFILTKDYILLYS
jgi:hypothetical protein